MDINVLLSLIFLLLKKCVFNHYITTEGLSKTWYLSLVVHYLMQDTLLVSDSGISYQRLEPPVFCSTTDR